MTPLEESLQKLKQEYSDLCGNIGHLAVQNLYNQKEKERLEAEILVVIKKTKSLNAQMKVPTVEEKQDVSSPEKTN